MDLGSCLHPWSGFAFRHIPASSPYDVLDFRFAGLASDNRWNYQGEATLYLASDRDVVVAEFARHLNSDRSPTISMGSVARELFRLQVSVEHLLDLTDSRTCESLSLKDVPHCFLNKGVSRAVAQYVRQTTRAQVILVPSMAFLDEPEHWVMVVFLEKLPSDPKQFLTSVDRVGDFKLSGVVL